MNYDYLDLKFCLVSNGIHLNEFDRIYWCKRQGTVYHVRLSLLPACHINFIVFLTAFIFPSYQRKVLILTEGNATFGHSSIESFYIAFFSGETTATQPCRILARLYTNDTDFISLLLWPLILVYHTRLITQETKKIVPKSCIEFIMIFNFGSSSAGEYSRRVWSEKLQCLEIFCATSPYYL